MASILALAETHPLNVGETQRTYQLLTLQAAGLVSSYVLRLGARPTADEVRHDSAYNLTPFVPWPGRRGLLVGPS